MATRNLTDAFVLMRNNALQTKHIYAEQNLSAGMALIEMGNADSIEMFETNVGNSAPPVWIDALEETQYILSRLRVKIQTLLDLQSKHLTRPTLEDMPEEERQIEQLTREIGRAFATGHRQVQTIKNAYQDETRPAERRLAMNAAMALSSALQDLVIQCRTAQNNYFQQVDSREERNKPFFEDERTPMINRPADCWLPDLIEDDDRWPESKQKYFCVSHDEMEDSIIEAIYREKKFGHIVKNVSELNDIFKDLANMIHDQGTVLDRIDYNIEQSQVQVYEGYQQLKKADSYQRASRKMYCIFVLAGAIIILSFLFVILKT